MKKTVVALYPRLAEAERAIRSLVSSGFPRDRINLIAPAEDEHYERYFATSDRYRFENGRLVETPGAGAESGATATGIGTLLAGMGLLMIPAIGPILAAGPLAAAVASGAAGAAGKDLVGILEDAGVPEREAEDYAEAVRRGATMLLLATTEEEVDGIVAALHPLGPEPRHGHGGAQPLPGSGP